LCDEFKFEFFRESWLLRCAALSGRVHVPRVG
jgi:hypothetical protein